MDVLMTQANSTGAAAAAASLVRRGHNVVVCHPEGQEDCVALSGGRCPLDVCAIDAAVVIRSYRAPGLPLEDGALCAARRGLPLVVGGDPFGNPFARWTSAEEEGSDVARTVETVVASPLPHLSAVATASLRAALRLRQITGTKARVEVRRRNGGLFVELIDVDELDRGGLAATSVRVAAALRAADPWVRAIDVSRRRHTTAAAVATM